MTDVQVSNARRIGFTALALVVFWVLAWRAYQMGRDVYDNSSVWSKIDTEAVWTLRFPIVGLLFALVSVIFLSLSIKQSILSLRTRFVLLSAVLIAMSTGFSCWVGELDVAHQIREVEGNGPWDPWRWQRLELDIGPVSWFRFLLPIILTTAFVIFGAWRSAVRDADVQAVGEDE
jgi:hypothetical protein